jgi:tRNA pseudouridine38-40 synthase
MRRIKITLAYDGAGFHGWQIQPDLPTIQGALQQVASEIEGQHVEVAGSGRTDAGVHALAQVAAFSLENRIPPENLKKAMNRLLPAAIRILRVEEAAPEFHPRFDAHSKLYEYRIFRGEVCPPFERAYVNHYPYPLDVERLIRAAPLLEGEHDFSAFAASDERDKLGGSKVRTIFSSRAELTGERLVYRVRGSGFLKHMVRNIVGTLIEVGKKNVTEADLSALLAPGTSVKAGPTVPARGLFLVEVDYGG